MAMHAVCAHTKNDKRRTLHVRRRAHTTAHLLPSRRMAAPVIVASAAVASAVVASAVVLAANHARRPLLDRLQAAVVSAVVIAANHAAQLRGRLKVVRT